MKYQPKREIEAGGVSSALSFKISVEEALSIGRNCRLATDFRHFGGAGVVCTGSIEAGADEGTGTDYQ